MPNEMTDTTTRDLVRRAATLGPGWRGLELTRIDGIGLKLFAVDPAGLREETHPDYAEGLLMLDGAITLVLDNREIELHAGDFQLIPAGRPHSIRPGGHGAYFLVDPEPPKHRP